MRSHREDSPARCSRRQVIQAGAAGIGGFAALAALGRGAAANSKRAPAEGLGPGGEAPSEARPRETLRVATCQFPVSGSAAENARHIGEFLRKAAESGANLLHTSEASLSGYAGIDFPSFDGYDWAALRRETDALRKLTADLGLWMVLGSTHFLDESTKPTNCLYLVAPDGTIADRYDKCMCTGGDQMHYSAGERLVTRDIRGVRIGLAICYDICWPQIYIAYRDKGATVMIHSFHNARSKGENCLDVLNVRQVPTRCADNRIWAVANNSSQPYSHWGSFIARPDATIAQQLERNRPGMLVHDFPDGLSEGGWYHNPRPMKMRDDEILTWGVPSAHPRQRDGQSEP